ncbi:hypothetical protein QBC37DRAFT_372966 [Rhypophila decipiens]|uniref:Secreted protein n=1 Tax=Rhypophila decipiens TaxID=261697 RepID=A0AAN6Y9J7_9PEZI|nr:hypothetical protein QBC37DRAFT_372966 [Rhypophila decipiens]
MYPITSMSFLLISLLATVQGWQVLIIDEAEQNCQPKPNTRARLLLGSNRMCMTLGGNMGNTECVHHVWDQPSDQYVQQLGGCQDNFFPQSARYFDMGGTGAVCEFFESSDCSDRKIRPYSGGDHKDCAAQAVFDGADGVPNSVDMRIQSFKCTPRE